MPAESFPSLLKGVLGEELSMAVGLSASLSPGSTCLQREGLAGGCSWFLRVSRASLLSGFLRLSLCYRDLVILLQGAWWCVHASVHILFHNAFSTMQLTLFPLKCVGEMSVHPTLNLRKLLQLPQSIKYSRSDSA